MTTLGMPRHGMPWHDMLFKQKEAVVHRNASRGRLLFYPEPKFT